MWNRGAASRKQAHAQRSHPCAAMQAISSPPGVVAVRALCLSSTPSGGEPNPRLNSGQDRTPPPVASGWTPASVGSNRVPKSSIGELGYFVVDCGSGALWRIKSRHKRSQPMDGTTTDLREKLDQLLRAAAEVSVALDRVEGLIVGIPHYSVIEGRAHELGQQLSRRIQAQHMGDLAAHAPPSAKCPECGTRCDTSRKRRQVRSVDGAEARSFERAAIVMKQVGDQGVSAKTIERVVHDVGPELAERRDADPKTDEALAMRPASPPELAVVECDGGRIRTREPGHGPGVHSTTEGWRETKNAVLIRASRTVSIDDPQPEPPACFCDSEHVAKIAETAALSVASSLPGSAPNPRQEHCPERAKPAQAND